MSNQEPSMHTDDEWPIDEKLRAEMDLEKQLYPGADTWARDEERLFEMMFLRQELPILPRHWEVDFRGVPISERSFSTGDSMNPMIYAHIKEFRATVALTRLVDLTANVRTACQSGLRRKAPAMIKKTLDSYLSWAAEDGGFGHLKVVPNIVAEIIDPTEGGEGVAMLIENRMRALANLQREYFHFDGEFDDPERRKSLSWMAIGSRLMDRLFKLFERRTMTKPDPSQRADESEDDEMVNIKSEDNDDLEYQEIRQTQSASNDSTKRREPQRVNVKEEEPDDTIMTQPPSRHPPRTKPTATGSCSPPPVVYGLFIVATSVFLMTVDSSKGNTGHVSFHVETNFKDHKQSVWNALTMAMVACVARDEIMSRLEGFEEVAVVEESDPDA